MEALGIDYKLLIAQLVNFIIFYFIFKKFFSKPLEHFIDAQKKNEQERERITHELKKKEENAKATEQKIIAQAQEQSSRIINEAKQEAERLKKDILQKTQMESAHIKAQAKQYLEEEKSTLYRDLKSDVIKTSVLMLKSSLREVIDEKMQRDITDKLLQKLEKSHLTLPYEN